MLAIQTRRSGAFSLLFVTACLVAESWCGADADGIDLYLEACRSRGDNPAIIQSLSVDLEVGIVTEPPTRQQVDVRVERLRKGMTDDIQRYERDGNTWMVERLTKQLANIDEWATPQIVAQANQRLQVHVLYRQSPETGNDQYLLTMRRFDRGKNDWLEPVLGLRERRQNMDVKGIVLESDVNTAVFNAGAFTVGVRDVRQLGRIQGQPALMATSGFIIRSDPPALDFSAEKIARFKEEVASITRKHPDVHSYQIKEERPFEGSSVWVIETERAGYDPPVPMQRTWIDPTRGAICPLVELFYQNGRTAQKWESSDYFQVEESGLWYPQRHVYTEFDENGTMKLQETYEIDRDSVRINFDPDASLFAITLPGGCSVIDARTEPHKTHKPDSAVLVFLESLAADIESLPLVASSKGDATMTVPGLTSRWWLIAVNALVVCVIAVIAVLRYLQRRDSSGNK